MRREATALLGMRLLWPSTDRWTHKDCQRRGGRTKGEGKYKSSLIYYLPTAQRLDEANEQADLLLQEQKHRTTLLLMEGHSVDTTTIFICYSTAIEKWTERERARWVVNESCQPWKKRRKSPKISFLLVTALWLTWPLAISISIWRTVPLSVNILAKQGKSSKPEKKTRAENNHNNIRYKLIM